MVNSRFPNRLKKYRRLFGLSQKDVAAKLGLSDTSTLSRWEKGVSMPNLLHLFRLSRLYRTMPTELYSDLWQTISKEIAAMENNLLAHHESFITSNQ
jgi:transcriptional regulator with XRE-family HTH domain